MGRWGEDCFLLLSSVLCQRAFSMKGADQMAMGRRYLEEIRARLGRICTEQMEEIRKAAAMAADTIVNGGTCYHHPQGHMIPGETRPERSGHPQLFVHTSVNSEVGFGGEPLRGAEEVAKMQSRDFLPKRIDDRRPVLHSDVDLTGPLHESAEVLPTPGPLLPVVLQNGWTLIHLGQHEARVARWLGRWIQRIPPQDPGWP